MYVQLAALLGGLLSLHDEAQDAESAVATHFGGKSAIESGTRLICAQQMGFEVGQSDAVEHWRVAFALQEAEEPQAFVCAARLAQHT